MSDLSEKYLTEFKDKETRQIYVEEFLNTYIATQIKVLREDREWTQAKLAEEAGGMKQERISVMEDVNYESWTIKTLKRLARAFDLRLSIKFETFGSFLRDFDEFNRSNLGRVSFGKDPAFFPEYAEETVTQSTTIDTTVFGKATQGMTLLPERKPDVLAMPSREATKTKTLKVA